LSSANESEARTVFHHRSHVPKCFFAVVEKIKFLLDMSQVDLELKEQKIAKGLKIAFFVGCRAHSVYPAGSCSEICRSDKRDSKTVLATFFSARADANSELA
jgi:hypothetical protein